MDLMARLHKTQTLTGYGKYAQILMNAGPKSSSQM